MKMLASRIGVLDLRRARPPPKEADPWYATPAHQAWRAAVIARAGARCQDPDHDARRPRTGIRLFADHVRELQDGGDPLDPANGMARCGTCHSRKTAAERAARQARSVATDGGGVSA